MQIAFCPVDLAENYTVIPERHRQYVKHSFSRRRAQDDRPAAGASDDHPAVRRFVAGADLDLSFIVHNAKIDKISGHPNLEMQLRILKDGNPVYTGPQSKFDPGQQADYSRIGGGASIRLKKDMEPGHYVLQLVCADLTAKADHRTATQWIDFEVAGK